MSEEKTTQIFETIKTPPNKEELAQQVNQGWRLYFERHGYQMPDSALISIEDLVPPDQKELMFTKLIPAMKQLADKNGFAVPDTNLLNRLLYLEGHIFSRIEEYNSGPTKRTPLGLSLPNGIAMVNYSGVKRQSEIERVPFENYLKRTGLHELWHTLDLGINFVPPRPDSKRMTPTFPIRLGIVAANGLGELTDRGVGLYCLNEGFTEYRTKRTFEIAGETYLPSYPAETEFMEYLIGFIGEKQFFDAAAKRDGVKNLSAAIDNRFGPQSFKQLLKLLYNDYMQLHGSESYTFPYFENAHNFIRRRS
jgi:hypothetical protein